MRDAPLSPSVMNIIVFLYNVRKNTLLPFSQLSAFFVTFYLMKLCNVRPGNFATESVRQDATEWEYNKKNQCQRFGDNIKNDSMLVPFNFCNY